MYSIYSPHWASIQLSIQSILTRMVLSAQHHGLIAGMIDHLIPNGVAMLQYADDTIICLENNVEKARNMKILLYMFEQMSGLKINFEKSEVLLVGGDNNLALEYADLFNCQVSFFPIRYLGVPISASRLHVADWAKMEEKPAKKLDTWQGNSLSIAGRTTLINSSLVNSTIYHMSMYLLPKTVIKRMDKNRRKFFWQGGSLKKKYHLVQWRKVCRAKKQRGLGIKNLRKVNVSLLCKWWWALENGEGLWQDIVRIKYVKSHPTCLIPARLSDSPIWSDLLKVRHIYLKGRGIKVNNGQKTSFSLDNWMDDAPLCVAYTVLYDEALDKKCSMSELYARGRVIQFRTRLQGVFRAQWYDLAVRLNNFPLNGNVDMAYWKWMSSRRFTVKSVYEHLTIGDVGTDYKKVWSAKMPTKIKIFMWLIEQDAILTKDNLLKRN
jgi:hypothetical protein